MRQDGADNQQRALASIGKPDSNEDLSINSSELFFWLPAEFILAVSLVACCCLLLLLFGLQFNRVTSVVVAATEKAVETSSIELPLYCLLQLAGAAAG